jgi:hypothetical protein
LWIREVGLNNGEMLKKIFFLLLVINTLTEIKGQNLIHRDSLNNPNQINGQIVRATIIDGDTLLQIDLKQINILPPLVFTSKNQVKRYTRLVVYVTKVYPYSQIVSEQLEEIHSHLDDYKTEKQKKEYIKIKEKELKEQFEGELRKLTFTQGKILIKLINRETGQTTFDIVKELKGSLNAFFWQSIARLFGSNLKLEYDAKGDDRMIEDIVVRIENGEL